MPEFNAFLSGIRSDDLFPALHGGAFTVVEKAFDHFTIKFDGDGRLLRFDSEDSSTFTYSGDTPTGGAFNQITLLGGGQVPFPLARWAGGIPTALTSFNSSTLADDFLAGLDGLSGSIGDDVLRGHGGPDIYVGGAGDDVFEIDAASGAEVYGANDDGTGGAGETNTIKALGTLSLSDKKVSDIDALVFAAPSGHVVYIDVAGAFLTGFSQSLAITGNDQYNRLVIDAEGPAVNLDLSGWTFDQWTAGVDEVSIGDTTSSDTIVGTRVNDRITSSGGVDTLVGKGGNDTFRLADGVNPAALHGSNASGTGAANEVNLIDPGSAAHDLRAVTLSNIDGFTSEGGGTIAFDPSNGSIIYRYDAVVTLDADQFGSSIAKSVQIIGKESIIDGNTTFGFEVLDTKDFDASGWKLTYVNGNSVLHVTGTDTADRVTGWSAADVVVLGKGNDVACTGAGKDYIFAGEGRDVLYGGAGADRLFGGSGSDTASYAGSATGVRVNLTLTTAQSDGQAAGDILTSIENVIGSAKSDVLIGNSAANNLTGGHGRDTLTGGKGADRFDFNSLADSKTGSNRDVMQDFHRAQHDKIDLAGIDADTHLAGNQAFHFIGRQGFSSGGGPHVYGELRFENGLLEGDVNGDGRADFQIKVAHVISLVAGDFFL